MPSKKESARTRKKGTKRPATYRRPSRPHGESVGKTNWRVGMIGKGRKQPLLVEPVRELEAVRGIETVRK